MTSASFLATRRPIPPVSRFDGVLRRKCTSCGNYAPRAAACAACAGDRNPLLPTSSAPGLRPAKGAGEAPAIAHDVLRSPGHPLPPASRAFFESRFAQDFSGVRVHNDPKAAQSALAADAAAYTMGQDIVFGAGRYAPQDKAGQRLLAHELAHVVQQRQSAAGAPLAKGLTIGSAGDPLEREADLAAERVLAGGSPVALSVAAPGALQRAPAADPAPSAKDAKGYCGPDATQWIVDRANEEMNNADVVFVKDHLTKAAKLAPWFNTTAGELGEAGTTAAVLGKETALGDRAPPRTAAANAQIAQGEESLATGAEVARKTVFGNILDKGIGAKLAYHMLRAGLAWKDLVTHQTRYDFKTTDLKHPKAGGCPDPTCDTGDYGSVTICPSKNGGNCYETDAPGNIFYSMVGKYVGWTELTIKLGSQLAELMDEKSEKLGWDSPEDTNALTAGYALNLPLSTSKLCGNIQNFPKLNRWSHCLDCPTPFSAKEKGK